MRNRKIIVILLIIFTIFFNMKSIKADNSSNIVMWLECDYEEHDGIKAGRPIVLIGGQLSNEKKDDFEFKYRLLNERIFVDHAPAEHVWYEYDNPDFDKCWFKSAEDIDKSCTSSPDEIKYSEEEAMSMLRSGVCPAIIRKTNDTKRNIVFAGEGVTKKVSRLKNQYMFTKKSGFIWGEGFNQNGYYINAKDGEIVNGVNYINGDISGNTTIIGGVTTLIERYKENFMNLEDIDTPADTIIFGSGKNIGPLHTALDNWVSSKGNGISEKSQKMEEIVSNNATVINSCKVLNEKMNSNKQPDFSQYSAQQMLTDLNTLSTELEKFYLLYSNDSTNEYSMCTSEKTTSNPVFSAYNCSVLDLLGDINYVPNELQQFILNDIQQYLEEDKGFYLDEMSDDNVLESALKCSTYLYKNYDSLGLSKDEIYNIKEKYEIIAKDRGISFVVDCESLLGSDLVAKIKSYINIVKLAIPIILIGFGTFDFFKAIFAGSEDDMKKAQQTFLKRLMIAIIIFLVPTIVELILTIANKVWIDISNDTCGIF